MVFIDNNNLRIQIAAQPNAQQNKPKKIKKRRNTTDIILSSAIIGAGGVIGDVFTRNKNIKKTDKAYNNLQTIINETMDFVKSSEKKEAMVFGRIDEKPYDKMVTYFEKMKQIKEKPQLENPNCLLFISQDKKKAKGAIDWFADAARQRYSSFNVFDENPNLLEFLEQMEENFQKTGDWNLIYVKDMDKAINPSEVESNVIAAMKGIMCRTAEDYHSTLLFQTKDITKLDDIAIESNRIGSFFDIDNMKHFDEFKNLYNKYNKQLDLVEKLEKSAKHIGLKGMGIGLIIGGIITGALLIWKKITNKKEENKNEG